MHFRARKNVIQLIRTTYDAQKKRGVNTIVGTVRHEAPVLDDDLRALLTTEEIEEFCRWRAHWQRLEELKQELAARTLPESLASAIRWFERQDDSEVCRGVANEILPQW